MKKITTVIASLLLAITMLVPVKTWADSGIDYVWDATGTIQIDQMESVGDKFATASDNYNMYIAMYIYDEVEAYEAMAVADKILDELPAEYQKDSSIIFVHGKDTGTWYISTSEDASKIFTDARIQEIGSAVAPYLRNLDYVGAAEQFLSEVSTSAEKANAEAGYPLAKYVLISAIIGLVVALIGTAALKGQLKTVAPKNEASDYVKPGSMRVHVERDLFLYRHVEREKKPENNNNNNNTSTTHTSAAGVIHGGGGGKI